MKRKIAIVLAAGLLAMGAAAAQQKSSPAAKPSPAASKIRRTPDGHPDLSGLWTFAISIPPGAIAKVVDGRKTVQTIDRSARYLQADLPGALPWTKEPSYKPELRAKVADLAARESKVDPVFYCGRPGVPRIGSPRRIVQTPKEMIFLYEDISGDPYRIIPIGRPHRKDANPTYYGDSVGRWEGDTLVVDVTNFNEDGWFGEEGYFHSD